MVGVHQCSKRKNFRVAAVADIDDARVIEAVDSAAEKCLNLVKASYLAGDTDLIETVARSRFFRSGN
jgi:hypothetical protein